MIAAAETRTLEQVKATLARDAARDIRIALKMAQLIVRFGNATDEAKDYAREFIASETCAP